MRHFTVIQPSEAHTDWTVKDQKYYGFVPGFIRGWCFEFKNENGEYAYNSMNCFGVEPEQYVDTLGEDAFLIERFNGYEPTGRVMFRGYFTEHYDPVERDWFVEDVPEDRVVERIKEVFHDWNEIPRGEWSEHAMGDTGLYREEDGSYTVQGYVGDDVVLCTAVDLGA